MNQNQSSQLKQGYLSAVRLLTASKKSAQDIAKRLRDKGYTDKIIQQILNQLIEQKLLNDQKLVSETIHWAQNSKRLGRNRIVLELKKRGIKRDQIDQALDQFPEQKEREIARELAKTRWEKLLKVEPKKRQQRLYSYLVNRGFSFDLARDLVNELKNKAHENA